MVASAGTVLVTEWLESSGSLAQVIREGTQAERDHYGHHFLRFMFEAPGRTGMLHADPAPRELPARARAPTALRGGSASWTSAPSRGCPSASSRARSAR